MAEPVAASCEDAPAPLPAAPGALSVLLVNAMGDAALATTEQRFLRLLQAAFPGLPLGVTCSTLAAIPRGEMAAARIARHYGPPALPDDGRPDLVIFTGAEPLTEDLRAECFWPELTALFDQVAQARIPAVFSCLAAHAAVLHFAGVRRRRAARKVFGVFAQDLDPAHPLATGAPARFAVPHSRWNAVDAEDLRAAGYDVLSCSPRGGVDAFVPATGLPHLYLQGHPEYDAAALQGEYRRDLRRHESGLLAAPPHPPDLADLAEMATAAPGLPAAGQDASGGTATAPGHAAGAIAFCRAVMEKLLPLDRASEA